MQVTDDMVYRVDKSSFHGLDGHKNTLELNSGKLAQRL